MNLKLINVVLALLLPVFCFSQSGKEVTEGKKQAPSAVTVKSITEQNGSSTATNSENVTVLPAPLPPCEIKSVSQEKLYPGKSYLDFKITGNNILKSALVKFNNDYAVVDGITGVTASEIKTAVSVREGAKPGKLDLIVQNSPEDIFVLKNAVQVMSKPGIGVVLQKEIKQGSIGNEIIINGSGFLDGARLVFTETNGDIAVHNVVFISEREVRAILDVSLAVKPKETKLQVINPDGESASNRIVITTALGVSGVTPQIIPQGAENIEISVKGSNLNKGLKAETTEEGFYINNIFVLTENEAVLSVSIAETAVPGKKELSLIAPDGVSQKINITVSVKPMLNAVTPDELPQGTENRIITVTGNNFGKNTQIKFSTTGIIINNLDVKSAQQVVAVITVSERAPGGSFDVLAVNPDGGTGVLKKAFTVNLKPELKTIFPATAVQGVFEQELELSGQGFTKETTVKLSGEGIVINNIEFLDSTRLKALVTVGAKAPMEKRDISVLNPDGGSFMLNDTFGISKVDKESIYYGDINKFKKPAMVNKKKLFLEHPYYKTIVRENISSEVAKYWLIINKINESVKEIYKKVQKKYDYDLVGELGFVTDKDGNPVRDIPDITDTVIRELEK